MNNDTHRMHFCVPTAKWLREGAKILGYTYIVWGTRWRSWLGHCATSRKVAGSIPDGVLGLLHCHNTSDCSMALGLTQPQTEMSTKNISWG